MHVKGLDKLHTCKSLLKRFLSDFACLLYPKKMNAKDFNWPNSSFWQSSSENAHLGHYNECQDNIFDCFVLKFDTWIPWTMIHTHVLNFSSSIVFLGGFKAQKDNIFMLPSMSSNITDFVITWWFSGLYQKKYPR